MTSCSYIKFLQVTVEEYTLYKHNLNTPYHQPHLKSQQICGDNILRSHSLATMQQTDNTEISPQKYLIFLNHTSYNS